jgi:hypothetical protein
MPDEVDIFESFRRRPGMFTGENTLKSIKCYLDGYHFAMDWHGLSPVGDPLLLPGELPGFGSIRAFCARGPIADRDSRQDVGPKTVST